jgi:hypothetical protein
MKLIILFIVVLFMYACNPSTESNTDNESSKSGDTPEIEKTEEVDSFTGYEDLETREEILNHFLRFQDNIFIGDLPKPTYVIDFTERLGNPDSHHVDDHPTCPAGQFHFWDSQDLNYQLFVLGDCYEPEIDYQASTRLWGVKIVDVKKKTDFSGFFNFYLGDSYSETEKKLNQLVLKYPDYSYESYTQRTIIDDLIFKDMKYGFMLYGKSRFFFFAFNAQKQLVYIIQTDIHIGQVC